MTRFRAAPLAVLACLSGSSAFGEAAQPSSTSATYGNWTVNCSVVVPQQAEVNSAPQACEMVTKLNLKGDDGQLHPLLQIAIGQPLDDGNARIVLHVPGDVALREPIVISLDTTPATDSDTQQPRPQTVLLNAFYLACPPSGCIADAVLSPDIMASLQTTKTTNVTFTALTGAKKITVPVDMTGFVDAVAALNELAK